MTIILILLAIVAVLDLGQVAITWRGIEEFRAVRFIHRRCWTLWTEWSLVIWVWIERRQTTAAGSLVLP